MGRAKKVDRDTAKAAALSAFWIHGYRSLGVRKLEELTGINRFALQTEFGGKEGLFHEVTQRYQSHWLEAEGNAVRTGKLDQLADYFLRRTRKGQQKETRAGCLMFNLLGDGLTDSPVLRAALTEFTDALRSTIVSALKNEDAAGTLAPEVDIDEASQMLVSSLIGINLLIRTAQSNEAARPAALAMHRTIMGWRIDG